MFYNFSSGRRASAPPAKTPHDCGSAFYYQLPKKDIITDVGLPGLVLYEEFTKNKLVALCGGSGGSPVYVDLKKAPHLLIGGATLSGKSVCINTILFSLLLKNSPNDLKLFMIDPKKVDYYKIKYSGLPHLCGYADNLETAKKTINFLLREMNARYKKLQSSRVDNIAKLKERIPYIICVFDEFASFQNDKELTAGIEEIARLGRACGIHLIIGIQRPDSKTISGQIKANIPARICFKVSSKIDSRIILDRSGGEMLSGSGDGLILHSFGDLERFQGFMMSDEQKQIVLDWWKDQPFKK